MKGGKISDLRKTQVAVRKNIGTKGKVQTIGDVRVSRVSRETQRRLTFVKKDTKKDVIVLKKIEEMMDNKFNTDGVLLHLSHRISNGETMNPNVPPKNITYEMLLKEKLDEDDRDRFVLTEQEKTHLYRIYYGDYGNYNKTKVSQELLDEDYIGYELLLNEDLEYFVDNKEKKELRIKWWGIWYNIMSGQYNKWQPQPSQPQQPPQQRRQKAFSIGGMPTNWGQAFDKAEQKRKNEVLKKQIEQEQLKRLQEVEALFKKQTEQRAFERNYQNKPLFRSRIDEERAKKLRDARAELFAKIRTFNEPFRFTRVDIIKWTRDILMKFYQTKADATQPQPTYSKIVQDAYNYLYKTKGWLDDATEARRQTREDAKQAKREAQARKEADALSQERRKAEATAEQIRRRASADRRDVEAVAEETEALMEAFADILEERARRKVSADRKEAVEAAAKQARRKASADRKEAEAAEADLALAEQARRDALSQARRKVSADRKEAEAALALAEQARRDAEEAEVALADARDKSQARRDALSQAGRDALELIEVQLRAEQAAQAFRDLQAQARMPPVPKAKSASHRPDTRHPNVGRPDAVRPNSNRVLPTYSQHPAMKQSANTTNYIKKLSDIERKTLNELDNARMDVYRQTKIMIMWDTFANAKKILAQKVAINSLRYKEEFEKIPASEYKTMAVGEIQYPNPNGHTWLYKPVHNLHMYGMQLPHQFNRKILLDTMINLIREKHIYSIVDLQDCVSTNININKGIINGRGCNPYDRYAEEEVYDKVKGALIPDDIKGYASYTRVENYHDMSPGFPDAWESISKIKDVKIPLHSVVIHCLGGMGRTGSVMLYLLLRDTMNRSELERRLGQKHFGFKSIADLIYRLKQSLFPNNGIYTYSDYTNWAADEVFYCGGMNISDLYDDRRVVGYMDTPLPLNREISGAYGGITRTSLLRQRLNRIFFFLAKELNVNMFYNYAPMNNLTRPRDAFIPTVQNVNWDNLDINPTTLKAWFG